MLTELFRPWFARRAREVDSWRGRVEEVQRSQLDRLVRAARNTLWGQLHHFRTLRTYEDFDVRVAQVSEYPAIRPYVMRMLGGEKNLLWPGRVRWYAQSSGTSDGRSKYIPITREGFSQSHYRGAATVVATYLRNVPGSRLLDGKSFILGGSFANELKPKPGVHVGDLSANLILNMSALANLTRIPGKQLALLSDWERKLPGLIDAGLRERRVTNISGVPSWFLTVITGMLERSGRATLHDIWPRLELFMHGGISFAPYRERFEAITDPQRMHFVECYNASEGFFAVQDDPADPSLRLMLDCGTFYEFMPVDDVGERNPRLVPAWEVEAGRIYAMVVTSVNGLWRYAIGDTVKIVSTDPLKITIAGRTRHYINAFGEEVMVYNADAAIARAAQVTGASVLNYTAAPVFADGDSKRGRHQWLVEFERDPKGGVDRFATVLDAALQEQNSDYQAKRTGGLFLDAPEVIKARPGQFDRWLASTGKLGGQRKVPRLCNTREFMDPLLKDNHKPDHK